MVDLLIGGQDHSDPGAIIQVHPGGFFKDPLRPDSLFLILRISNAEEEDLKYLVSDNKESFAYHLKSKFISGLESGIINKCAKKKLEKNL